MGCSRSQRLATAGHVVERESGRVMRFPSYVPPDRILEEYDEVVADDFPEDHRPATLRLRAAQAHPCGLQVEPHNW